MLAVQLEQDYWLENKKQRIENLTRLYVEDLVLFYGHAPDKFYEQLEQELVPLVSEEGFVKEREMLIRMVRKKYPPMTVNPAELHRDRLSHLMMSKCGMKGSTLIELESDHLKTDNESQYIRNLLAIFREWTDLVDSDPDQREDFMNQGRHLLQKLLVDDL